MLYGNSLEILKKSLILSVGNVSSRKADALRRRAVKLAWSIADRNRRLPFKETTRIRR